MRSLTYLVAISLDGFIAADDGSFDVFPQAREHIDWLLHDFPETMPGHVRAALDLKAPNATFDTVVMGWNTFAVGLPHGIDDPYPHLRQFVCSRTHDASGRRRRRALGSGPRGPRPRPQARAVRQGHLAVRARSPVRCTRRSTPSC